MKVTDYPKEIERAALDLAATYEELSETRDRIEDAKVEAQNSVMTVGQVQAPAERMKLDALAGASTSRT